MTRPLTVSIIIPVYNEASTLAELIARVRSVPLEKQVIVVDDGSTDGTAGIVERLGLRPLVNPCSWLVQDQHFRIVQ